MGRQERLTVKNNKTSTLVPKYSIIIDIHKFANEHLMSVRL